MRAAAKFRREIPDAYHAHLVAILFSEQRHGVILVDRLIDRHVSQGFHPLIVQNFFIDEVFNILQFFIFDRGEVRKIKAQVIRRHQRSSLLHMLPQNFAQPGMQQMRRRVITHGRLANVSVHHRIDLVAYMNRLLRRHLMRPHSLNRRIASGDIGDDGVVVVRVKPSLIANLPAGFGVERRVIEHHFAGFAGLEFLRALPVANDGENLAAVRASLTIAFEDRFRKLLIGGIGSLFGCPFPGRASAGLLFG